MKWFLRIFLLLLAVALIGVLSIAVINRSITEVPLEEPKRVAIIFGARVWNDGNPSNSLYDRVLTGVELYRAGRVKKLLMSGDNPTAEYEEPTAMYSKQVLSERLRIEQTVAKAAPREPAQRSKI